MLWPLIAALGIWLIECSYMPQIYRLWKRKEANEISLLFPGLNLAGRLLAMLYSIHIGEMILVFGFMLGLVMRATLLCQVIHYRWLRPHLLARQASPRLSAESGLSSRRAPAPSR